uniref:Amino acid transporter n=1 Tax=Culicoides sonorensis TaxID=179676 RepID=A0A336L348_CULSO
MATNGTDNGPGLRITRTRSKWVQFLQKNSLTFFTILGVLGGCALGLGLKTLGHWTPRERMYLNFPGDIFLRMLKCLIVPLLVSSITSAIGALDLSLSKKIAIRSIVYYFVTTVCAVVLGIILVNIIRPGDVNTFAEDETSNTKLFSHFRLANPNSLEMVQIPLEEYRISHEWVQGTNVLGLVMFSVIMGAVIGKMGSNGKPLQDVFQVLSEGMMIITSWVIWLSPAGIFFLIAEKMLEIESFSNVFVTLGWYFVTVMLGLIIHGFGTIAVIFFLTTRRLPYPYISKMGQVLAAAFGTGSSSAIMPVTIGCLDDMGIDPRVTRFVIPVGATINMDGTALYEAVAALFIAQLRKVPLTFGHIVAVSITATAASIGAAGIPQAGLVTMIMVLDTVGLPAEDAPHEPHELVELKSDVHDENAK